MIFLNHSASANCYANQFFFLFYFSSGMDVLGEISLRHRLWKWSSKLYQVGDATAVYC